MIVIIFPYLSNFFSKFSSVLTSDFNLSLIGIKTYIRRFVDQKYCLTSTFLTLLKTLATYQNVPMWSYKNSENDYIIMRSYFQNFKNNQKIMYIITLKRRLIIK